MIKQNERGVFLCIVCGAECPDYLPQYCCDGVDCGCCGLPVEPPFCSQQCFSNFFKDPFGEHAESRG